jgi:hypothetical protein
VKDKKLLEALKKLSEDFVKVGDILKTEPELKDVYKKFVFVSRVSFDWTEETVLKIMDIRIANEKKNKSLFKQR